MRIYFDGKNCITCPFGECSTSTSGEKVARCKLSGLQRFLKLKYSETEIPENCPFKTEKFVSIDAVYS